MTKVRLPITATAVTKTNTVKKEILIKKICFHIKKVCFQFKKVSLQRKKILSHRKKICLHTQNKPTANSHGKYSRQIATASSCGKFTRQILTVNSHGIFPGQITIPIICDGVPILLTSIIIKSFMFYSTLNRCEHL